MARKSKVLNSLSNVICDEYIINDNEIESVNVSCEFVYEIEANAIYVVDKRDEEHITHSLESIILTLIFAMMANCNRFTEIHLFMCKHFDWLDKHIHFDNGIPSISTLRRVISFINPKDLEQLCVNVMSKFLKNNKPLYKNDDLIIEDIKPMDGKTANSSDRKSSKNGKVSKMNAMSIVSVKNGNCEATEFIGDKTNEIPTGPELLKRVNVKNNLITFDALSTQKDTIDYIAENGGYYIATVKGNQETLENNLIEYFSDSKLYNNAKQESYKIVVEKGSQSSGNNKYEFHCIPYMNEDGTVPRKLTTVIEINKWNFLSCAVDFVEINYYINVNTYNHELYLKRANLIQTSPTDLLLTQEITTLFINDTTKFKDWGLWC